MLCAAAALRRGVGCGEFLGRGGQHAAATRWPAAWSAADAARPDARRARRQQQRRQQHCAGRAAFNNCSPRSATHTARQPPVAGRAGSQLGLQPTASGAQHQAERAARSTHRVAIAQTDAHTHARLTMERANQRRRGGRSRSRRKRTIAMRTILCVCARPAATRNDALQSPSSGSRNKQAWRTSERVDRA